MSIVRGLRPGQVQNYEYVVAAQNLLVNPGFEIWQRGAGPFSPTGGGVISYNSADEWPVYSYSISSVQRSASAKIGNYCLQVVTPDTQPNSIMQGIESFRSLEGQTLTFSCWVKSTVVGSVWIRILDVNAGGTGQAISAYNATTNWERLTVVYTVRTGLTTTPWTHAMPLIVQVGMVKAATYLIDGATCVVGNYPEGVPFIPLMPAEDLRRCQRFFEIHGGTAASHPIFVAYSAAGGVSFVMSPQFKEQKYAAPTCTISGNWTVSSGTLLANFISQQGYALYITPTVAGLNYFHPTDSTGIVSIAVP